MPKYTPRPKIAKLCAICSTEFFTHNPLYIYCSDDCRAVGRKAKEAERLSRLDKVPVESSGKKICKTCGQLKPLTEYSVYRTRTYKTSCKACAAAESRQRRRANPERTKEIKRRTYAKNRERWSAEISTRIASDPDYARTRNERTRKWRERNLDHVAKWRQEYYARKGEMVRQYSRDVKHQHPDRYRARYRVASAVERGKFPPASTMVCEHCQEAQAAHWHHHKGYSEEYALDVIALCLRCHGKEHRLYA